jgi:hypothetical protein
MGAPPARAILPPTAHRSGNKSSAAHAAPNGPNRRILRGVHGKREQHTPSYLKIARDRNLWRDIAIRARLATSLLPTRPPPHLSAAPKAAHAAPLARRRRVYRNLR